MCNNANLALANINAYAKSGRNPSIRSQDIEWKRNSDINQGPKLSYKFAVTDVKQSQPRSCRYQCICKRTRVNKANIWPQNFRFV